MPDQEKPTPAQTTALWCAAFFDELVRCGVRQVVVSPGSRSTPLAMAAYELSCRRPDDLELYVDIDERGAAFLGLGMAKAQGRPVACICTSGTAAANYYPAVIEAETSRVPLILLTGDRPERLQGLGAPQTTDQLKLFGNHVRAFRAMPLPSTDGQALAFVRQAAFEAVLAAMGAGGVPGKRAALDAAAAPGKGTAFDEETMPAEGVALSEDAASEVASGVQVASRGCDRMAGPVQVNFPFDEPFTPDFAAADELAREGGSASDAFDVARKSSGICPFAAVSSTLDEQTAARLQRLLEAKRVLVLAGEGTCSSLGEAHEVVAWAKDARLPLLADPLSGLRSVDDPVVIDAYDAVLGQPDYPAPQAVIRFGRYPVSKRATTALTRGQDDTLHVVVDAGETRDYPAATDMFVPLSPLEFVRATAAWEGCPAFHQDAFLQKWIACNDVAAHRIERIVGAASEPASNAEAGVPDKLADHRAAGDAAALLAAPLHEGAVLQALLKEAPAQSCVFAANSMAVRNVDTFLRRSSKPLCVMANRGQNGIDGTLSSAIGAAQHFRTTTFITGDLTLQHDINALALQRELQVHHAGSPHTLVVVLLNNNGGAIFDMLPQASAQPYFQRLFLTPQDVEFCQAASAFGVPYYRASSMQALLEHYQTCLTASGISLIEVCVPLRGLKERLGGCWR